MTTGVPIDSRLAYSMSTFLMCRNQKVIVHSTTSLGSALRLRAALLGIERKISEAYRDKLWSKITYADGYAAARLCMRQVLAQAKLALGSLDRITKCIRLGGFVNAEPDFASLGATMNGASAMIVEIMGEPGRHSRTTISVATLPLGACIEVEALFAFE